MATTYQLISSVTVGSGGASSIDFTSIPATYTDLLLKVSGRSTAAYNVLGLLLKINNSTANFSGRALYGDGSAVASYSATDTEIGVVNGANTTSSTFNNAEIYIPNYAGNNNKSLSADSVVENNAAAASDYLYAKLWSQTTAINQLTLSPYLGNFAQYSTAYLYGIKNS